MNGVVKRGLGILFQVRHTSEDTWGCGRRPSAKDMGRMWRCIRDRGDEVLITEANETEVETRGRFRRCKGGR
jgi:hypothetical protein